MIQPVNALTPRATFRGKDVKDGAYGKKAKSLTNSDIALINAGGVAAAAGGLTAIISRAYTSSWAHSSVLGLFGAFLTMFFMTPHLIEKITQNKAAIKPKAEMAIKQDSKKFSAMAKEYLIPAKKFVQFRSEQA